MTPIEYSRAHAGDAADRLIAFLRIPSVSAVPEHADDMQRAAAWVATRAREAGFPEVRIDQTEGHPVVYASWRVSDERPTVLVYGHYDVQPPDPIEAWDSPPFEPTLRDGALYARGASDDKGQLLVHLEAVDAYRLTQGAPPVNMKLVLEGEEEIGSPSLPGWLSRHAADLTADVALISDTAMIGRGRPSLVVGLRGLAYLEVVVTGPSRDLHSGQFGGAVRNPAIALCQMVATLLDADGRVTVPGFYDRVRRLTEAEREELARVPFDWEAFERAAGIAADRGEAGYSVVERLGARPSLDVNGLWSGWTGQGAKTVLPARAAAKISMRLVPDQDPTEIAALFAAHMQAVAPAGVDVDVHVLHGGRPALVDRDTPAMRAAVEALTRVFGRSPALQREGGTIPVVAMLDEALGLPSVLMGFGLPDDNLHAPNEKMDLEGFRLGIESVIVFQELLAAEARDT